MTNFVRNASRDGNFVTTLVGVSSLDGITPTLVAVDPTTGRVLVDLAAVGGITSINADSTAAQLLVVGTAGTDFAIVDNGTGTHTFNLPVASATNTGKLSSTDWSTFNGKQNTLTLGNLTDAGTDGIVVTNGGNSVIGSGTSLAQHVADTTHNGYLSSTDWNTFNGKGSGTVTAVSIATANGFSGSSSGGATPALTIVAGAIVPTSVNGLTITTSSGTLTMTNAKTLTVSDSTTLATSAITLGNGKILTLSNTLTLAGTDSTVMTFPSTSATIARKDAAQTFTGTQTFSQVITTANTVTVTSNAGTVPVTSLVNNFTNSSASAMTITLATSGAVDGQSCVVRIYDASAVTKGITWVNTENSAGQSAPSTSAGSTTIPLSVGFKFNGVTSLWTCLASA